MGYMEIENLYKDTRILLFKECWATEKIHGTTAWIAYNGDPANPQLQYHPGGAKYDMFVALFNDANLKVKFVELFGNKPVKIHGEHYGGKIQGMSSTYGTLHKFAVFDFKIGDTWLSFDKVQTLSKQFELECVDGAIIPATIEALNLERDKPSVQAVRNAILEPRPREGIVIRPLIELTDNNGKRIITKHKGDAFRETSTPRDITPEQLKVLTDAEAIADEWVTPMRLNHVIDTLIVQLASTKAIGIDISNTGDVIKIMVADIEKESKDETTITPEAKKAIGKRTSKLFHDSLKGEFK
jgi:hypothetical protein